MHGNTLVLALSSAALAFASPIELQKRACPPIHVFGARETTASPGYGSAGTVVNKILAAHSGATAEAINYPACGGGSACGGVSYSSSVQQGTAAVVSAVSAFAKQCPSTELVLVGYSQVSWWHEMIVVCFRKATDLTLAREVRSSTTPCAATEIPSKDCPVPAALLPTTSKRPSSWATHALKSEHRTTLVPARLVEYVRNLPYYVFKVLL